MNNKYTPIGDEEYQMIEAYIDKPEVTDWYVNSFNRFSINGIDIVKWNWSWWAFFGGVFYLLYRKAYIPALIVFILNFLVGIVPFGHLILWILTGGYAPYFVYKTYKEKRLEVVSAIEDKQKRLDTLRILGGTNEWALWIGVILSFIFWAIFLSTVGFIVAAIGMMTAVH